MLVFIATLYGFGVWLIYFKFKLLPYNKKNKIISSFIGVFLILFIMFTLFIVAPYSKQVFISGKVNTLAPEISGKVSKIFIQPGNPINKGEPLFLLDTESLKIQIQQAEGNLNTAKAAYKKGEKQRNIAIALSDADPDSISELQLINTEETLNELKGQYETAKSTLDKALYDLSKSTVYAPTDGFSPYIAFDNETTVSAYKPILPFVSLTELQTLAFFSQSALAFVQSGDQVEILLDIYPGHVFKAKVERIVWAAGEAQIFQGRFIPKVEGFTIPNHFAVIITLEENNESYPLHFGAKGQGVVYTQHWKPFHIIQKIHIRMQAWLKYLALP